MSAFSLNVSVLYYGWEGSLFILKSRWGNLITLGNQAVFERRNCRGPRVGGIGEGVEWWRGVAAWVGWGLVRLLHHTID